MAPYNTDCEPTQQAKAVQDQGALAVVFINGQTSYAFLYGVDDSVTIPVTVIGSANGAAVTDGASGSYMHTCAK